MVFECDGGYCQFTKLATDREQLQVSLMFKRDELLHDVSNNSWVQSEVSASDNVNANCRTRNTLSKFSSCTRIFSL